MTDHDDFDSPWKDILELYFAEFMAFFFPEAHTDIDWSRGYESLDSELQKIVRDAQLGKRLADKLMSVYRLSGEEQLILIHLEIQGHYERQFPLRMYVYHYRLFDKYHRPIVSLAVLGDDDPKWRPNEYRTELWGCETNLRFPVVKLTDYGPRWADLEQDRSPFAVMVMTHLRTRATKHDPAARLDSKMALVRALYERNYDRQQILELFRFIDWLLHLPDELEQRFQEQLQAYEATMSTPYITSIERRGIEKGIQQGIEQGIEQGIAQGLETHARATLRRLLTQRFGALPSTIEQRIEQAQRTQLDAWLDQVIAAPSLESIFGIDSLQ